MTPPPPRAWIGDTRLANSAETQAGNDNLLPATNPQVAEKPNPEPKATEEELEEGEIIDPGLEPGAQQWGKTGGQRGSPVRMVRRR